VHSGRSRFPGGDGPVRARRGTPLRVRCPWTSARLLSRPQRGRPDRIGHLQETAGRAGVTLSETLDEQGVQTSIVSGGASRRLGRKE